MATRTPNLSAAARSRRSMPPPPTPAAALSPPFSPAPLRARRGAVAGAGADSSSSSPVEQPCVRLWEWWLARVEGEERKLAVSGYTEKNDAFTSAPIAKRYEPLTIEDEDGVVVLLVGSLSLPRMHENGFSAQICERFMIGFPFWWETWDSHMKNFPEFFIDPREGSTQFYLQKFQLGNFLETLGPSFIQNLLKDAKNNTFDEAGTFTECSRFEEYTCGSDISTKEKSAESNDARPALVASEVDNVETDLIASSPSQQKDNVDIHCNLILGPTDACTSDETCQETGNQNDTIHPAAVELEAGGHLVNSNLIFNRSPDCMPRGLEDENTSAGNSEGMVSKCLLDAVPPEKDNFCSDIAGTLQGVEPLSYESTPLASLKNQVCLEGTELITVTQKAVPNEDTSTPVHSDAQSLEKIVGPAEKQKSAQNLLRTPTKSPMARSPILYVRSSLTPSKAKVLSAPKIETLQLRSSRSGRLIVPRLDPATQSIIYNTDGSISGVTNSELQRPQGCESERPAKRRRKSQCPTPYRGRLLQFDGNI
ncbi:uncharacterized protein LOC124672238 [Lolium rigidum]|uniref:uncharacterized protein LOC124672238 n=1 Tax=Lolium rigidum TaxID=89674 RepID=UPI001F5D814C|nr:uncharacterized protein LOC124672238 [Lolium rigidum]